MDGKKIVDNIIGSKIWVIGNLKKRSGLGH